MDEGGVVFMCLIATGFEVCLSSTEEVELFDTVLWLPTAGVMKKLDKLVEELLADIIGVAAVESPSTGEVGKVKFPVGELALDFFNLSWT